MPDDNEDRVRRRDDAVRDIADNSPAFVRRIAIEEAERVNRQAWNDVGVDIATFAGKNEHARSLEFLRKLRALESEMDENRAFVRELRRKANEVGTESRKGMIALVYATIAGAVSSALATYFATRH